MRCFFGGKESSGQDSSSTVQDTSSLRKMPSCHRCSSSIKIEENMATCPICATHYHNAFDCGERIKKSCIANGCSMNVLEAAAPCPKCAKLCICAGGHVRHDSLPCFLTACLLACFLPVNAQNTNTLTSTLPSKQQVKCHAGLQRLRRQ